MWNPLNGSGKRSHVAVRRLVRGAVLLGGQQSFDLTAYKGQSTTIKFTGTEDASLQSSFVIHIDDTALMKQ